MFVVRNGCPEQPSPTKFSTVIASAVGRHATHLTGARY